MSTNDSTLKSVTLRERQKSQTYELILSCARQLFEAEGYKKTTIRRIAAQAGISLGAIYKHFKQKSDVLSAVFIDDIGGTLEEAIAGLPTDLALKDQLLHLVGGLFRFYEDRQKLARVYIREIAFMTGDARMENDKLDQRFLSFVSSLVEEAKLEGHVRADVDSGVFSFSFLSNYLITIGYCFFKENAFSADMATELIAGMIDLLISGIGTNTGE